MCRFTSSLFILCAALFAQGPAGSFLTAPYPHQVEPVINPTTESLTMDSTVITMSGVAWMRLVFSHIDLGPNDFIRITSVWDNATQTLTPEEVAKWQNTSCCFNGDSLVVSLVVAPFSTATYTIESLIVEPGAPVFVDSICGPTDDRALSTDWRALRAVGGGYCTIWCADPVDLLLSAGHCTGAFSVAQAEVPLSSSGGSFGQPAPNRQWPISTTLASMDGGTGNDYAIVQVNTNSDGDYPADLYGYYQLSTAPPSGGTPTRITGYGSTNSTLSTLTWNGVNKTHAGPFVSLTGTRLRYSTDTTGGNSGAPVINDVTGEAIGIHTHGGCSSTGGSNSGTHLAHSGFQAAWALYSSETLRLSSNATSDLIITPPVPPTWATRGYTLFSFDTSGPVGGGPLVGLQAEPITIEILMLPPDPGYPLHFTLPAGPAQYPNVPLEFPAGSLAAFAGAEMDMVILFYDLTGQFDTSNVVRWAF